MGWMLLWYSPHFVLSVYRDFLMIREMDKAFLLCCVFSGLLATVAHGEGASPRIATQADIDNDHDNSLRWTARNLKKSDIVLTVIVYKFVKTDQGATHYARVIQSLRGDIPVEALIKWNGHANKLPAGSPPKTVLDSDCTPIYVLSSSKDVKKLEEDPEDFRPASTVYSSQVLIGAYDLGNNVAYFPMTESDPGRAMKRLLRIEPAKITEESEAARFQTEAGE